MAKPEKKFTSGTVEASVWNNKAKAEDGTEREFKTVGFARNYKDKEGTWQSTSSLRISDIPKAMVVLGKAYEYLVLKEKDCEEAII